MIPTILIFSLAFIWLLRESDYLRVRLSGTPELKFTCLEVVSHSLPLAQPVLLLTEVCERTRLQKEYDKVTGGKYKDSWVYGTGYNTRRKESYQVMAIGNQKITLCATLPNLYELIREVEKSQTEKPRKPNYKPCQLPMDAFIKTVRIGSHKEWIETTPKHGFHRIVEDTTTHYNDCLPGKEWLKAHEHDLDDYEPTIEITIDGKSLSVNGNYKQGMIGEFMAQDTVKVRAGKKTMTILKGGHVENCGGGVYIAVNEA